MNHLERLSTLPTTSGVYFFRNNAHTIIYVGKAKNLRKRVSSYFQKNHDLKTTALVSNVRYIDYMSTRNEKEALLWENSLIKRFKPKYNIDLKDDKTYPYIKFVNVEYPYITLTRANIEDGSKYYGPYVDVKTVRKILRLAGRIFPLRKCKKNLSTTKCTKPCLQYHLGYCLAPCCRDVDKQEYKNLVENMKMFLNGDYTKLEKEWHRDIEKCIKNLDFEKAANIKKNIEVLESMNNFDIRLWQIDEQKLQEIINTKVLAIDELQNIFKFDKPIKKIAGFDISNISGKYAVGSRVFFEDGKPNKDRYRRYKIKTVEESPNDFAMMAEVIRRCVKDDEVNDIDLFLIDGGKGQVNAAFQELQKAGKDILVVGLAKREEILFLPHDTNPIVLEKDNPGLQLLMQVRDEAHRFAVRYHRYLRGKM